MLVTDKKIYATPQKLQVWRRITDGGQLCNSKPTFLSWQNFIPNEGKPLQAPLENTHFFKEYASKSATFAAFCLACYPWTAGLLLGPKPASPPVWRPTETTAGGYVKAFAVLFPILWSLTKHCLLTHTTQPVSVRQAQLKPNSAKLLHFICKSYNVNGIYYV